MARGTTILGLVRLEKKLKRLPKVAKEHIRAKMEEAANTVVTMMKSLVPTLKEPDQRRRAGALRDSIAWTWGQAPRGSIVISTLKGAGVGGDLTLTIYAGGGEGIDDAYYARWVEFGTSKMKAQPYFYVSWRANRTGVRRKVRAAVRSAAKKVAAGG